VSSVAVWGGCSFAVYAMLARLAPEVDLCVAFTAECAGGRRLGQLCKLCTKVRI
jgi:hypothetical protein